MPHTGSTASAGAPSGTIARTRPTPRIPAMSSAAIATAISAGVLAPMGSPPGGCTRAPSALGEVERVQDRGAANLAGHQADVADAVIQCRADGFGFRPAMAGDHDRGGGG